MARALEAILPRERASAAVERLMRVEGVVGIRVHHEVSVSPEGSLLALTTTTDGASDALQILAEHDAVSIVTSEPLAVSTPQSQSVVEREGDEALWDEVSTLLRREGSPSLNLMALTTLAGVFAGVGLWLDRIHVIVAAMLIAPGFVPLLRPAFGLVAGPRSHVGTGAAAAGIGYAALAAAAAAAYVILETTGDRGALVEREWVRFFSTTSIPAVVLSTAAASAGALVVTAGRAILTAGVMVALALVPAAALVAVGVATGEFDVAASALARWALDVALVTVVGGCVFALKQALMHRGRSFADRGSA